MADEFSEFWKAYPRRVAKGDARKAWEKASQREPDLLAKCLDALAWQVRQPQWTRDDGAYVPYPATWLNRESYDDEPMDLRSPAQRAADERHEAAKAQAVEYWRQKQGRTA